MGTAGHRSKRVNGFAVGDLVQVRPAEEILAGLDERGERGSLQFMPEMLQFAGRQFRVGSIANKTCDTVNWTGMRKMENTVHLAGLRCDGQAHGGCQAGCLLYWNTDWLIPATEATGTAPDQAAGPSRTSLPIVEVTHPSVSSPRAGCTPQRLAEVAHGAARADEPAAGDATAAAAAADDGPRYSCQATELPLAVREVIPIWNVRQYVDDVQYGNAPVRNVLRGILVGFFNQFQDLTRRVLPERLRFKGGVRYPFITGTAVKHPVETLDLQPGEWVRVKSAEEIAKTLNENYRNRGLYFDREMLKYCGQTARVNHRVNQIIEETTGRMITMKTPCIILSDVVCTADFHRSCPRAIYAYWREVWLERVPDPAQVQAQQTQLQAVGE